MWFVPTADVLPAGRWSLSAYRVNTDYDQGFTDVSNWPVTFGVGVSGRAEIFAALTIVNRIDRDVRPDDFPGAVVNDYPFVTTGWTGSNLGDLRVGAKLSLALQSRGSPAAMALRAVVKVPTADRDTGAGTGKADVAFDAIVSREMNERVELSSFGGFIVRGDPEELDLLNGFRWGFGVGLPTRRHSGSRRKCTARRMPARPSPSMERRFRRRMAAASPRVGAEEPGQRRNWSDVAREHGLFAGGGLSWNLRMKGRSEFGAFEDETG